LCFGSRKKHVTAAPAKPMTAAAANTAFQPKSRATRSAIMVATAFIISAAEPNQPNAWPRRAAGAKSATSVPAATKYNV
jgi:hypothetical protein